MKQLFLPSAAGLAGIMGLVFAIFSFYIISSSKDRKSKCMCFLLVLFISGYVSLSSMTAVAMFPILLVTVFRTPSTLLIMFSIVVAVAVIITHAKNIRRLLRGEEKKFIRKKKD